MAADLCASCGGPKGREYEDLGREELGLILEMMSHPGWKLLHEQIRTELGKKAQLLIDQTGDSDQLRHTQAVARCLLWFVGLEDRLRDAVEALPEPEEAEERIPFARILAAGMR